MKRVIALLATALLVLLSHAVLNAHGGGLDANGGHNDRAAGNYHFHRGPLAGKTYASKTEAVRALSAATRDTSTKPSPSKSEQSPAKVTSKTSGDIEDLTRTVYVTRTGERYHGPNCSSLRRSKSAVTLKEARARGLTECAICKGR